MEHTIKWKLIGTMRNWFDSRLRFVSTPIVLGIVMTIGLSSCGKNDPNVRIDQRGSRERNPPFATGNLPEFHLDEENRKASFGVISIGMRKHVDFKVRNKGTFPLIIKKYWDSCGCIDVEFLPEEIPPGESGIVRVIYKPTAPRQFTFYQVFFKTNDPNNPDFKLQIKGSVVIPFELLPMDRWDFGKIDYRKADQRTSFRGHVISRYLENFEMEFIEFSSKKISARFEKIDEKTKRKLKAKSGYAIDIKLEEQIPVGVLYEGVRIVVSIGDHSEEILIRVRGTRLGPFVFQPIGGVKWSPEENWLDLGKFPAKTGKSAKIALLVKDLKDFDFKLTKITTDPDFLKIRLVKVEKFQSETLQKFELIFEVLPNSPPMTRLSGGAGKIESGKIEVETNHPFADRMVFYVDFISN